MKHSAFPGPSLGPPQMFHVKHLEHLETSIVSRETLASPINQGFAVSFTTPGRYSGGSKPVFSSSFEVHLEGLGVQRQLISLRFLEGVARGGP